MKDSRPRASDGDVLAGGLPSVPRQGLGDGTYPCAVLSGTRRSMGCRFCRVVCLHVSKYPTCSTLVVWLRPSREVRGKRHSAA